MKYSGEIKRMFKEDPMPRCPYCDDELCYCVFDVDRRIARFRCPTCDSEFPPTKRDYKRMIKYENSCHGCKWLDRDMKSNIDGDSYCCLVERSSQKHEPHCKIRRPDKIRCKMCEASNWTTRFQKRSDNNV